VHPVIGSCAEGTRGACQVDEGDTFIDNTNFPLLKKMFNKLREVLCDLRVTFLV
jgi:hypothetical protein